MNKLEQWLEQNIPNLSGKVAVITGANSGIGYEAARLLAMKGAQVVLAVRNTAKGGKAARQIRSAVPEADLEVMALDLASLASMRSFAALFLAGHDRLDLLLNNAGVMAIPRGATADGFEMQFGTNHLGHFALTGLLLPLLQRTPGARVVTVSSGLHRTGQINFDDLQSQQSYSKWGAYGQSKLANLLFAYELQRQLDGRGQQRQQRRRAPWLRCHQPAVRRLRPRRHLPASPLHACAEQSDRPKRRDGRAAYGLRGRVASRAGRRRHRPQRADGAARLAEKGGVQRSQPRRGRSRAAVGGVGATDWGELRVSS